MIDSLYIHEYEDEDFEQYEDEISLENAKNLIQSNDSEEIIYGISLWVGQMEEIESLIKILFDFIKLNKDSDVVYNSFEELTNLVVNDMISNKDLAKNTAQRLLAEMEKQNDSDLDPFKYLVKQHFN
ncbi:hypothetical protein AAHH67_13160 [Niallia circulans]